MTMLNIDHLSKNYVNKSVLQDLTFNMAEGEILCLLGPSGCGKTTLLRLIAGLEQPDSGRISYNKQDITAMPPHQRGFGLMFQEFALFPHKNVADNVAFGLQMKGQPSAEIVHNMLDLVGLAGFERRDINSLSGGERQRVALARSLAPDPRLLMLDEPLGALDRTLRERLMLEIRAILKRVGVTAIYVTHDQTEAFAVADRIMVLHLGHMEQLATPEELYHHPASPRVAQFLGFTNLIPARIMPHGQVDTPWGVWQLNQPSRPHPNPLPGGEGDKLPPSPQPSPEGRGSLPPSPPGRGDGGEGGIGEGAVQILIRPEAASLEPLAGPMITGYVETVLFRGRFYQVTMMVGAYQLTFELTHALHVGQTVQLWLEPRAINILKDER